MINFSKTIKSILPSAPNIIQIPAGIEPPQIQHLDPLEQLTVLYRFYSNLKCKQEEIERHNEDEIKRAQNAEAFSNLFDLLDQVISELNTRRYEIEQQQSYSNDDDWDREM